MEKQQKERIEVAYKEIKSIYKRKGLYYTFYTFYRNFTCPIKRIFQLIPSGKSYIDIGCGYGQGGCGCVGLVVKLYGRVGCGRVDGRLDVVVKPSRVYDAALLKSYRNAAAEYLLIRIGLDPVGAG